MNHPSGNHRLLFTGLFSLLLSPLLPGDGMKTGVDMNYALEMEKAGRKWTVAGQEVEVFATLAKAGCDHFRVRLWVGDDGVNGLNYATDTARRAQAAGMKPMVTVFLSDQWADFVKQPRPAIWKDLDDAALAAAVEAYTERVARHFSDAGIAVEDFEIGNEIDFGICGVFEEEWPKRVSLDHMREKIWPRMAVILAAAERGVRKARPEAKFVLHLTQWENADYCLAFWNAMKAAGVTVDFAGLSYFPTAAAREENRSLEFLGGQVGKITAALGKPVVICETGYPSQASLGGQFADWNKPVPGRLLDEAGQSRWLADLLKLARGSGKVDAVYYWSPEWAGSEIWGAFALFDAEGKARPALGAFGPAAADLPEPEKAPEVPAVVNPPSREPMNVYFGNLHSHTSYSDGTGTPEEAFTYARDVAKLDFLAITEHNHLLGGQHATPEDRELLYSGPPEKALVPTARRFNRDGRFIAIPGQEYSSMSQGNHVNVFDVPAVINVANGKFDQLLPWMDAHRDSTGAVPVLQLNHPALGSPFPPFPELRRKDFGRDDFGDDAGWEQRMGGATSLMEILNGEPPPTATDRRAPQVMDNYYSRFLQLGFHLAPTGNQDNHKANWGTATDVRTGILAENLTKPDLLAAMRARHVYATEDRNLKIIARIGGHLCGDIVASDKPLRGQPLEVRIADEDEPDATYLVEVLRGVIDGEMASVVARFHFNGNTPPGSSVKLGSVDLEENGQYVFLRITQSSKAGDDRTWTAPVWLAIAK